MIQPRVNCSYVSLILFTLEHFKLLLHKLKSVFCTLAASVLFFSFFFFCSTSKGLTQTNRRVLLYSLTEPSLSLLFSFLLPSPFSPLSSLSLPPFALRRLSTRRHPQTSFSSSTRHGLEERRGALGCEKPTQSVRKYASSERLF